MVRTSHCAVLFHENLYGDEDAITLYVWFHRYLRESLALRDTELRKQSFPPNPFLHKHEAVHVTSTIVQLCRAFPEGSENVQLPFPEHTVPEDM